MEWYGNQFNVRICQKIVTIRKTRLSNWKTWATAYCFVNCAIAGYILPSVSFLYQWRIYIVKFWTPPPGGPNSFNFMQFLGKCGKIVCSIPPEGWRPNLGEILDPPLYTPPLMHCNAKQFIITHFSEMGCVLHWFGTVCTSQPLGHI